MQAASISPLYVKRSMMGAFNKGLDVEKILIEQGLPRQILSNPRLRISTIDFAKLNQSLMRIMKDEDMGLLAHPSHLGQFQLVARASLCSRYIKDSLRTWRDGLNWLNSSTSSVVIESEDSLSIAIDCVPAVGLEEETYIVEKALSTCHRFQCWLAGEFVPLERVDLQCSKPEFSSEHRFVFYGAPVFYEQPDNALYFNSHSIEMEINRNRDELREMLKQPYVNILTQPRKSKSISIKVRLWMERLFRDGSGQPQLTQASDFLGMSEQTVRRRLKEEGYSFSKLKEDTRRDMAIYYIKQSSLSVEEISYRLGFSEGSTFIRAFKSWTGITPFSYRKM